MTTLDHLFPTADLDAALDAGYVTRKQHPHLPLSIYTYSRAAQYDRVWTPVTTRCRGLVVDDKTGEIVAWPFPKFFNATEHQQGHDYAPPLPAELFRVFDKVDGSLGIVFWHAGRWHAASKGSFDSEQARWAQAWLDDHNTGLLIEGTTYLAEIIYPENRIVVDYGARRDLVLLAAYDAAGREMQLEWAAPDWEPIGSVVRSWGVLPLQQLLKFTDVGQTPDGEPAGGMDAEGFVIRYASGLRAKVKFAEYVRLHKVITGISERDIWRYAGIQRFATQAPAKLAQALGCPVNEVAALLAGPPPLQALLEKVPDEFDRWAHDVQMRLLTEAAVKESAITEAFARLDHLADDRGAFALAAQQIEDRTVRAAMFLVLDGKPTALHVWRSIRPAAAVPYLVDDEA